DPSHGFFVLVCLPCDRKRRNAIVLGYFFRICRIPANPAAICSEPNAVLAGGSFIRHFHVMAEPLPETLGPGKSLPCDGVTVCGFQTDGEGNVDGIGVVDTVGTR